jgi:hypothetical protein
MSYSNGYRHALIDAALVLATAEHMGDVKDSLDSLFQQAHLGALPTDDESGEINTDVLDAMGAQPDRRIAP